MKLSLSQFALISSPAKFLQFEMIMSFFFLFEEESESSDGSSESTDDRSESSDDNFESSGDNFEPSSSTSESSDSDEC